MTDPSVVDDTVDVEQLQTQVEELERERKLLLAVIDILQEISGTLHFVDILQKITSRLMKKHQGSIDCAN